jgi:hypothetical protein
MACVRGAGNVAASSIWTAHNTMAGSAVSISGASDPTAMVTPTRAHRPADTGRESAAPCGRAGNTPHKQIEAQREGKGRKRQFGHDGEARLQPGQGHEQSSSCCRGGIASSLESVELIVEREGVAARGVDVDPAFAANRAQLAAAGARDHRPAGPRLLTCHGANV